MEDLTETLAHAVSGKVLRCTSAWGEREEPFQTTERERPAVFRWSADGERLWTCPNGGGEWSQWDPVTGRRLRRAPAPDDIAFRIVSATETAALVGRKPWNNQPERSILARSPDASLVITGSYHGHHSPELRCTADGSVVRPLTGMAEPFAFSPDGQRIVGKVLGKLALAIAGVAADATVAEVPLADAWFENADLLWAPGGALLINAWVPGHQADRLICFSLDQQKTLWTQPGYFRSFHVDGIGKSVATISGADRLLRITDIQTGIRVLANPEYAGPLLCGEPDTLAMVQRLRANPIRFACPKPITSLQPFTGEPPPPRRMNEEEHAFALRALAVPADSLNEFARSSDGSSVVFCLHRNVYEVPDPDAGSVVHSDPSLALWDRRSRTWRWETSAEPPEYLLRYLAEQGVLTFSWDESGIFVKAASHPISSRLYDVATGSLRAPRPGDHAPTTAGITARPTARVLASDRAGRWTLAADGSVVELWQLRTNERADAIDLAAIDDAPTVAAFVDGRSALLVGTERGRVLRFEFDL